MDWTFANNYEMEALTSENKGTLKLFLVSAGFS